MNADEIVRALRTCHNPKGRRCSECPVFSRYEHGVCKANVDKFAADLIKSLQAENTQLRAERDAAVRDILCADRCEACKFSKDGFADCDKFDFDCLSCMSDTCECRTCRDEDKWQWRGPQETEVDA